MHDLAQFRRGLVAQRQAKQDQLRTESLSLCVCAPPSGDTGHVSPPRCQDQGSSVFAMMSPKSSTGSVIAIFRFLGGESDTGCEINLGYDRLCDA